MAGYYDYELDDVYDFCHNGNTGTCYYCGKAISRVNYGAVGEKGAWEVDHFIPESRGGIHALSNWVPACVDCNTRKANYMPWEFDPARFTKNIKTPGPCL